MQLTVRSPDVPEEQVVLTLRIDADQTRQCSLCEQRAPDWFDDPAADTATNPRITPIMGPDICSPCLNFGLEVGTLEVVQVDPRSF